jgi:alkanesulfonate monooxygenase SsuD/methylene tetrahydromethanopterin reductase-like flavin-dependent oxidoreductase (luciferase family)
VPISNQRPSAVLSRPGPIGFRVSAMSPAPDWQALDSVWAAAGQSGAFDAGWMSDHLQDVTRERGGAAFEAVAAAAALAHRVPGMWIGVAVFANTFRNPQLLAKSATVIDNVTAGRFVLGLGAGWHVGEHDAFGLPLRTPRERMDRLESSLRALRALFSPAAAAPPGVTLDDAHYPLARAIMEPRPIRPGGPVLWLGGQGPRGMALAARYADGWPMPGNRPGDVDYFAQKRDALCRALEAEGRDPDDFTFAAQVECGAASAADVRQALELARAFIGAGANHLILAVSAAAGSDVIQKTAALVARPLREGWSVSAAASDSR